MPAGGGVSAGGGGTGVVAVPGGGGVSAGAGGACVVAGAVAGKWKMFASIWV